MSENANQMSFFPASAAPTVPANDKATKEVKSKTAEPEVYDKDRIVAYAGHQHVVTDRTLSLEQIRQVLERDFPELSKDRCEMTYNATTGIVVPVVKGSRKGGR